MRIRRTIPFIAVAILAVSLGAAPQSADRPRVTNARVETRPAGALETTLRGIVAAQAAPAWIGYAVPVVDGRHQMCCYDHWNEYTRTGGCCRLERGYSGVSITDKDDVARPVRLEAPREFFVLLRVEAKNVDRIRTFSADCDLDAGGLPFVWLTGARADDSLALLTSFVNSSESRAGDDEERLWKHALTAIALHAGPAADGLLERFVTPGQPYEFRKQAAFWLGSARGRRGHEILRRVVPGDADDKFREHGIFALHVSKEPEAVDTIISIARNDRAARVRGQALFWLAQRAGQKAAGTITAAIENDPDTEVKKKAVIALSQLPKDQGIPMLIQVARTNRNPAVRKQAVFWLGQSHDPRALAFFEEVLR